MKTFCRKSYNSSYYVQNRARILMNRRVRKEKNPKIIERNDDGQLSIFENSKPSLNQSNIFKRFNFETILNSALILLVILDSWYLLGEAFEFYRSSSLGVGTSVLAAAIVELMLIALSMVRLTNTGLKVLAKSTLVLLFLYSSWSFCSRAVGKGLGELDQLKAIDRQIERIESRMNERETLIAENLRLHRVTRAGSIALEKDGLASDLSRLEIDRAKYLIVSPVAQFANVLSAVGLRLLIQLSNIIILHHLGSLIHRTKRKAVPRRNSIAPIFRLVR